MGYFDENEENKTDDISALAEGISSKEEKRLEKERRKEEKRLEKERRKQEKLERRMEKEGVDDDLPEVSMKDLKMAAAAAAEESRKALEEIEGKSKKEADASAEASEPAEPAEADSEEKASEALSQTSETAEAEEVLAADAETDTEGKKSRRKKKKNKVKEKPENVNIVKDLLSLIIYIGIVVLICFLIVTYVGRRTTVHGDSMEPTLQSGDSLWVNMLAYRFGDPKRYDIIVFPYEDDVNYIKRIIGLPGETVQITDTGDILINGEVLVEPKKFDRIRNNGIASSPITLKEDEYFVLGDNRNNSRDSRWADVGNIKRDKIIGRAAFRLTPLKKFGSIEK